MWDSLVDLMTLIPLLSRLSQHTEPLYCSPITLELWKPDSCSALSGFQCFLWGPGSLTTSISLGVGTSYWDCIKDGGMREWPLYPEPSLLIYRKALVFLSPDFSLTCSWKTNHTGNIFSFLLLFMAKKYLTFLSSLGFQCFEAEAEKETNHKYCLGYKTPHYCIAKLAFTMMF